MKLAEYNTQEPPPVKLSGLIEWIESHVSNDEPYIDYEKKTIKDAWGNDIVVVLQDGKFVGVGSPGPDHKWQEGKGDDLIVTLEEVK